MTLSADGDKGKNASKREGKTARNAPAHSASATFRSDREAAQALEQYGRQMYAWKIAEGSINQDKPYYRTVFGQWLSCATRFNHWMANNPAQCDGQPVDSARALADQSMEAWEQHVNRYSRRSTDKSILRNYREFMLTGRVTMAGRVGGAKPRLYVHADQKAEWAEFKQSLCHAGTGAQPDVVLLSRGKKFFHFLAAEWNLSGGMRSDAGGKRWGPRALKEHDPRKLDEALSAFAKAYPEVRHTLPIIKKWLGIARGLQLPAHRQLLRRYQQIMMEAQQSAPFQRCNPYVPHRFLRHIERGHATDELGKLLFDRDGKPYRSILDLVRDGKLGQARMGALRSPVKDELFRGMSCIERRLSDICILAGDWTGDRQAVDADVEDDGAVPDTST